MKSGALTISQEVNRRAMGEICCSYNKSGVELWVKSVALTISQELNRRAMQG